jgi:hypothetical protein
VTQIPTWNGGQANPTSGRAAPGATIGGRYTLRAAVGHGGMGTVWRAADTLLRREVAVKEVVLPPGLAPSDRDAMYERTLREARAAAALQHPAVVQVYDVVTEGGRPWIVMELLDARSLADMVIEDGPLAPRAVAKIGIALLGALEVAHAIGVLHRDVKPANVLICSDGRCVLTDFGVARMPTDVQLTTPGMVLGSPHFISPERAMGSDFGPPSDLFSLGVTLYTAVEGRPPFDKGDPIETMHAVVEDPPAPPVRSGPLTQVLFGLLEKDPARRFDVETSRGMIRHLLAGPLASKAPGHLVTDPYAVVPAQRVTVAPPTPPATPTPSGQIGGRAMIGPGESLTDRLAALRRSGEPAAGAASGPSGAADLDRTNASNAVSAPTGAMPSRAMPTGAMPAQQHWDQTVAGQAPWSSGPGAPGQPPWSAGGGAPGRPSWSAGGPPGPAGGQPPWSPTGPPPTGSWHPPAGDNRPDGVVAGLRQRGDALLGTVRNWPRKVQLAAAGGLAVVLLIGLVAVFSGGSDPAPPPQQAAAPATTGPPAGGPTQPHAERGVTVNVPQGWKRTAGGSYVDYTDPQDGGRRVRILVENSTAAPTRFLQSAESRLKKNSSGSCAKPYAKVGLREVEVAGKPAAELEYTCGEGDAKRHGVWRAVIHDGKAYSFYLSVTDARFAESRAIFEEMARSFQLTPA